MTKMWAFLLISGFFIASPCFANEELAAKSRLAISQDVLGEWHLVYQVVSPNVSQDSLFFSKHQQWFFSPDGYVKNVAADEKHAARVPDESELSIALQTLPKRTRFKFLKEGWLMIERSPTDTDWIAVSIMIGDMETSLRRGAPLLKKGDLVFSYLTPENQPYMQRFLRRVPAPGSTQ